MDNEQEAERLRRARTELAQQLNDAMRSALGKGLSSEATVIAKLIEATLTNTATQLYIKIK